MEVCSFTDRIPGGTSLSLRRTRLVRYALRKLRGVPPRHRNAANRFSTLSKEAASRMSSGCGFSFLCRDGQFAMARLFVSVALVLFALNDQPPANRLTRFNRESANRHTRAARSLAVSHSLFRIPGCVRGASGRPVWVLISR